MSTLNTVGD